MRIGGAFAALSGMIARASNQLSTVVVTLVATRFLGPRDLGVFALAAIATTMIRTLLHTGAFEFLLKTPDERLYSSECLSANAILALVLSLVVGGAALVAQTIVGASPVTIVMLALLPSNLISAIGAWREALLMRTGKLTLYYSLTMATEIASAAIAIGLFLLGFKVYSLVWQVYFRNIMLLLLYTFSSRAKLSTKIDPDRLSEVIRWSISRYASALLSSLSNYGADLALGIFLSPAATGLYRTSSRLITAVSDVFNQPTKLIAMTTFSSRAAAGRSSNEAWPAMSAIVGIIGWSALAGIAVVSPQLVPLALGARWHDAAALIPILAVARSASLLDAVTGPLLVAYDHQRALFRIQSLTSIIGFVLLAAGAPFGILPATVAVAIGAALCTAGLLGLCLHLIAGSARPVLRLIPVIAAPVIATICGALLAQHEATLLGGRPGAILGAAISGGLAAWSLAILLFRGALIPLTKILGSEVHIPHNPQ